LWWETSRQPTAGWVFPGRDPRQHIKAESLGYVMGRLLEEAGIAKPGRGCHALRRTLATRYLQSNPHDLVGLKEILRHESIATTQEYVYLDPEDLAPRLGKAAL